LGAKIVSMALNFDEKERPWAFCFSIPKKRSGLRR
jgi:hypothetical protein